jgi:hypothetical protein
MEHLAVSGIDPFRPRSEPARTLYDAFQEEAANRNGRSFEEWCEAETDAVHVAAIAVAKAHSLRAPTREDVVKAGIRAQGHIDYGLQWACGVVEAMRTA